MLAMLLFTLAWTIFASSTPQTLTNVEEFLEQYGYLALSLGTFFEGELAILIASSLVFKGLYTLPLTILFGFIGSFLSDWMYFLVGRWNVRWILRRMPATARTIEPLKTFFLQNQMPILFSYRFLYGFRIVLPIAIGISGITPRRFLVFSLISGFSWASLVALVGYSLGYWLAITPKFLEMNILFIIPGFLIVGALIGLAFRKFMTARLANQDTSEFKP